MTEFFLNIVNMSISACWIVLAIILLRIVLKKAPKWINCVLWGLAGLRLVLPFSFESVFSLIPSAETITKTPDSPRPHIDSGVTIIDNQVNSYLQGNYFEGVTRPMGNFVDITTILAIVWIVGIAALLIYTIISFLRLKGKIGTAVLLRDNIYQSEAVVSPFVLGIIKPKIYLPFNMNGQDMEHVIAHEQAHIRRKDHLWKPLGFLILTLHWFNLMVWLGYVLLCRDIELACDEKVVKELNNEQRADYSQALLTCSVNRRMIAACPLAFGEVGVKDRIKSVLNYKKPAFWVIVVAIVASIVTAVCFLTNPKDNANKNEIIDGNYQISDEVYCNGSFSFVGNRENQRIEIKNKGGLHLYHFIGEVLSAGGLYGEIKPDEDNFKSLVWDIDGWTKYKNTEEFLKETKKAWYHSGIDAVTTYPYMLFLQKDGSIYLAFTDNENGKPTTIRWIYELEPVKIQEIEDAVAQAILEDNKGDYHEFGTECAAEGHIIYGTDVEDNIYTVYVLTEYNRFGFMNGYFVSQSGGRTPAVMTFEKIENGYELQDIKYAEDGSRYTSSIKEMFPKKYQYRVLHPTKWDNKKLWEQCCAYAESYLASISRTEEIRDYSQVEHTSLTDVGVSVEASNKFCENNGLPYNWDIGYYEAIENGTRYVYSTDYDSKQNLIVCTKEVYDTGIVVERIVFDGTTGEILNSEVYVETPDTEENYITFSWLDFEFLYCDKYRAIHYSTEDETETPGINIGEVYGEDLVDYLNSRKWKLCSAPLSELSSPGSVEFIVSDDCRITVYQKKNIFSKAYVVVTENGEKTYYKAKADDYDLAKVILKTPELTTSAEINNSTESDENKNPYFNAEVLEVSAKSILVRPDKYSNEIKSASKIYVSLDVISDIPVPTVKVGDRVRVIYNGEIAESYPAQINNVFAIYLLGDNGTVLLPTPLK